MKVIEDKRVRRCNRDKPPGDIVYRRCIFDNCAVGPATRTNRPVLRNVTFEDVQYFGCFFFDVAFENVKLHGLKSMDRGRMPLFFTNCMFRHVVISGSCCGFISLFEDARRIKVADVVKYYKRVDWALDVSKAEFTSSVPLQFVPGHLVRRDPETQVLVTRERLNVIPWKRFLRKPSIGRISIQNFLESSPFDSFVFEAPKRAPYFREQLEMVRRFREIELAEPD